MNYYSIYKIGEEISSDEFYNQRLQVASWVHWNDFVNSIIMGKYDSIFPLHIELCSTYRCNFNCPWCSCRKSRFRKGNTKNELSINELKRILDDFKEHNIGVQWTGGEPLFNSATIQGIKYGTDLGLNQCLFTNGSLFDDNSIRAILISNLEFVRISLNCADPNYHSMFHGNISPNLSMTVLFNLEKLCHAKLEINSQVKIGVSVVVDSKNLNDLLNTYKFIEKIAARYPFALNYIVIRAVNDDFEGIETEKEKCFVSKYNAILNLFDTTKLRSLGVDTILPNEVNIDYTSSKNIQVGCSVFSEIAPDGSMFLCSDQYGNKDFCIGNILTDTIANIWSSSTKKEIQKIHGNCFAKGKCPHYSRGWYFNMVFSQIEEYRRTGKMHIVLDWIQSLAKTVPYYRHSFYI